MPAPARQSELLEDQLLDRLAAAEEELSLLRQEFEHQQRLALLGTLAAGVAHETNNLLTPVLAYAQLAQSRPDDPQLQVKVVEKALAGVKQAIGVASAILGFASPEENQVQANVTDVTRETFACLGRDPAKDGITCAVKVPPDLIVRINPVALQQVLLNLLLNALAAMKGTRRASLEVVAEAVSEQAVIRVKDSGPGVPKELQDQLFEPFCQSRSGSGLGLWICRTLLEQAGGTIHLASSSQGATFTIRLPLA